MSVLSLRKTPGSSREFRSDIEREQDGDSEKGHQVYWRPNGSSSRSFWSHTHDRFRDDMIEGPGSIEPKAMKGSTRVSEMVEPIGWPMGADMGICSARRCICAELRRWMIQSAFAESMQNAALVSYRWLQESQSRSEIDVAY